MHPRQGGLAPGGAFCRVQNRDIVRLGRSLRRPEISNTSCLPVVLDNLRRLGVTIHIMSVPGGPLKRAIQDNTTGDRPVKRHDALGLSASSQTSTRSTNSGVNAPEVTFHASQASIQSEPVGAGPFDPSVLDTGAAESRNRAQSAADGSNGLSKVTTAGVGDAGANGNETDAVSSPRAKAPLLDTFRNAGRLVQLVSHTWFLALALTLR